MQTVSIVLSVGVDQGEAFEAGFRRHELPVWQDLQGRGVLVAATLSRLDISSRPVESAVQYLVVAIFAGDEGHEEHDSHPGFRAWDKMADAYQVATPLAFGGDTVIELGV